jgi:beta-fructofuranosidase
MKQIEDMKTAIEHTRLVREALLADPHRPTYHFATPEDIGIPGDPNGAFYANGRYHLMYLYACRSDGFRWGHLSSHDLVHWRAHPDAIVPDELDGGIFSGGAFVDSDGACYLTYWGLPVKDKHHGGIRIARSADRHFERWEKFANHALACTESGVLEVKARGKASSFLGCADPSNIWKKGRFYYLQTGNLCVLAKFKRDGLHKYTPEDLAKAQAPEDVRGDWVDLFRSQDLRKWEYRRRFYTRDASNRATAPDEDDMCPSFLPLPASKDGGAPSGKHLQLFISHNRGCQYYIGAYDRARDRFVPEQHGRMTWVDNTYFAPEALVDGKGRQIMWAWLTDNRADELRFGWSGVYGLPRVLWLRKDGALGMAPAPELEQLRCNPVRPRVARLSARPGALAGVQGLSCEIRLRVALPANGKAGLYVRANGDLSEYTRLEYDGARRELVFDATRSGKQGRPVREAAPFALARGEALDLTVFVDRGVIEVYANERQAICRRVYPENGGERVLLYGTPGAKVRELTAYEMAPANFC